jgi:hypothetical protein
MIADDEAYRFLGEPIGVDDAGCVYGVSGHEIARIGRDGHVAAQVALDALDLPGTPQPAEDWAVAPDGATLIPLQSETGFTVVALRLV